MASESFRKLVGKAMLEVNVAPFDIAEVAKTLTKFGEGRPFFFSAPRVPQDADPRSPACLRVREKWQRSQRTAEQWKEITPIHLAVSSRPSPEKLPVDLGGSINAGQTVASGGSGVVTCMMQATCLSCARAAQELR